jgi:hypothetical protein
MDITVQNFLIAYIAVAIACIGIGALVRQGHGMSVMSTFFFWTVPSQIVIRTIRGITALLYAIIR